MFNNSVKSRQMAELFTMDYCLNYGSYMYLRRSIPVVGIILGVPQHQSEFEFETVRSDHASNVACSIHSMVLEYDRNWFLR